MDSIVRDREAWLGRGKKACCGSQALLWGWVGPGQELWAEAAEPAPATGLDQKAGPSRTKGSLAALGRACVPAGAEKRD